MEEHLWEVMDCQELTNALANAGVPKNKAAYMALRRDRAQMKVAISEWLEDVEHKYEGQTPQG